MTTPPHKITASLLAALGLSSMSPVQQGAALVVVGTAALWASPVLAKFVQFPYVGSAVIKAPDNSIIVAPSDANGETRLTGLEPGSYSVRVIEGAEATTIRVGRDGRLAFGVREDANAPDPRAADPRARSALPVVRRWAEQIAFDRVSPPTAACKHCTGVIFGSRTVAVDVNASSIADIARETPNTQEAASAIVAERLRGGSFKDLADFANRMRPLTDIDFEDVSVRFGSDTVLVARGSDPKNPGFKMARSGETASLFGREYHRSVRFGFRFLF